MFSHQLKQIFRSILYSFDSTKCFSNYCRSTSSEVTSTRCFGTKSAKIEIKKEPVTYTTREVKTDEIIKMILKDKEMTSGFSSREKFTFGQQMEMAFENYAFAKDIDFEKVSTNDIFKEFRNFYFGALKKGVISNTKLDKASNSLNSTVSYSQSKDAFADHPFLPPLPVSHDVKTNAPRNEYELEQKILITPQSEIDKLSEEERDSFTRNEQFELEKKCYDEAIKIYSQITKSMLEIGKISSLKPEQKIIAGWFLPLVKSIKKEKLAFSIGKKNVDTSVYGPILDMVEDEKLAVIVMHELLNCILSRPEIHVSVTDASIFVGEAVQAEIRTSQLQALKNKELDREMANTQKSWSLMKLAVKFNANVDSWDRPTLAKVGAVLIKLLISTAKCSVTSLHKDSKEHAFKHEYFVDFPRRFGVIVMNSALKKTLVDAHGTSFLASAKWLPMIHPPRPWVAYNEGAYLHNTTSLMRTRGHESQLYALKRADLTQVFNALNCLGRVQWKINVPLLNLARNKFTEGVGFCEIPSLKDVVSESDVPLNYYQQKALTKVNSDLHSQRTALRYRLEVAEMFKHRNFYLPCTVDFRGRAYAVPPHLNPTGSDLCRSLLMFAKPKPLGKLGLYWLKVHLANLYGKDKMDLFSRCQWIDENMDNVIKSAENPLGDDPWWLKSEKPYETLAACIEISAAVKSPNPENFLSSLPVHMDGSCNGLQHFSALGRDQWGGSQVNLTPSETPQDVYLGVCIEVNRKIDADALKGHEIAKLLRGKVVRKVVKQTVMTSVYGVTFIGAKDQILARLSELDIKWAHENQKQLAAQYVAKYTFESLGSVFKGAWGIMEWLTTCANLIAKAGQPVSWITPLGLPVVQPYRQERFYSVKTVMQTMILADHSDLLPVSQLSQQRAFPPNFVHSLDSTHMMLTAIKCSEIGLDFASVHDSFWTHAGDINTMNEILRAQFLKLHSAPILEELLHSFQSRFPGITFPPLPPRGNLDLKQVLKSKYFFD